MKKITLLLCVMALWSCSKEAPLTDEANTSFEETVQEVRRVDVDPEVNSSYTVNLIAGQHDVVGTVTLTYVDGTVPSLIVSYDTLGDCTISETHLWVGGVVDAGGNLVNCDDRPANNPGNPLIGQFPYSGEHADVGNVVYTIENVTTSGCVAAHAVVTCGTGTETAWAEGLEYGGNSWAMYFEYDFSNVAN